MIDASRVTAGPAAEFAALHYRYMQHEAHPTCSMHVLSSAIVIAYCSCDASMLASNRLRIAQNCRFWKCPFVLSFVLALESTKPAAGAKIRALTSR